MMGIMILCILGIAVLVLFIYLFWSVGHIRKQAREHLAYPSKSYDGPAGDPFWEGTLPERMDDYKEPRYVYENLVESLEYLPENGRIIGYRISPKLVIHSRVHPDLNLPSLNSYILRYGGKLLSLEECSLLLHNWNQISLLREKAGDTPLNVKSFWALSEQNLPVSVNVQNRTFREMAGFNGVWCDLILKR